MAGADSAGDDAVDHYLELGLPTGEEGSRLTLDQIDKAYKTQSRLRHPDKRPDDPTATEDFQRLRSSYDVLRNDASRRAFDARLRARRDREARLAASGAKRRKAAAELDERERAAAAAKASGPDDAAKRQEKKKKAELQRELEEFNARRAAAAMGAAAPMSGEEKCKDTKSNGNVKMDKLKMLKVSWEGGADHYSAAKLEEIFRQFGDVEDIVMKTKKSRIKGLAVVVMSSKEAALAALHNHTLFGVLSVPLVVLPVEGTDGFSAQSAAKPSISNVDGTGFNDYEASTMKKLQEMNKRRKSEH